MKVRGLRWWIVALLFGAAVLNCVDRQTLFALAPTIQKDLDMNDQAYANVVNIFLVGHTAAYLVSGRSSAGCSASSLNKPIKLSSDV